MLADRPRIGVAKLIAIEEGGLGQVKVGSVGDAGEYQFIGQVQIWVSCGRVFGEGRNVVVELIEMEREGVDARR